MSKLLSPPSARAAGVPPALDAITMRGLSTEPPDRYATAEEMAQAIEGAAKLASPSAVAAWLASMSPAGLEHRTRVLARLTGATQSDGTTRRNSRI